MSLAAGTRLGAYEVVALIGAGGMGEVYRARDTKLGRDVALKILPASFARDPDRVARFQREAHLLAALNHPHIAAIHGLEKSGATRFLVLERVDGDTLADRVRAGPLPFDEALQIAQQIVEALAAAHEKGIVHRDLKPANIALTGEQSVKVLDFGLARALDTDAAGDPSQSPTLTFHATQAGVILGTAAYMSPEQAKGRAADKRSDMWAFGAVFYEMLTGRRAFEGADVSDTLASILRGEPDWEALPRDMPPAVRTLIRRCLAKDRQPRIADAAVANYVLRESSESPSAAQPVAVAANRRRAAVLAGIILVAIAGAAAGWALKPQQTLPRTAVITRFPIGLSADQVLTSIARHVVAVSPDGAHLVYVANNQLYLRAMDQIDAVPVRGTHDGAAEPFFSPDGQWIGYYATGHLEEDPHLRRRPRDAL